MSNLWYWDESEERQYWFCVCNDCGWCSQGASHREDLDIVECPECRSEYLHDEAEYL